MRLSLHKADVFFYVLLAFIFGVGAASFWNINDQIVRFGIFAAAGIIAVSAYRKTFGLSEDGIKKRKIGFLIGVLLIISIIGIYRFNFINHSTGILEQLVNLQVGKDEIVPIEFGYAGYVSGEPEKPGNHQQFAFRVKRVEASNRYLETDELVLVTTETFPEYKYGDKLLLTGAIESPKNYSDFDYITYLRRDGISFIAFYPDISIPKNDLQIGFFETLLIKFYGKIFSLKNLFEDSLNRTVAEPQASYLNGILTGSRSDIPADLKEALAITSTSHVLAISGYNIAIVGQALLFALIWFVRRRTAFWISVGAIVAFVILTGASSSVVRAGIMGLLLLFANGYGRLYNPRNILVFAAAAMVLINPFVLVFDIGFQLSFLAVMGILYGYPIFERKFKNIGKDFSAAKEIFLMTLSAQLFVLPFLIYYFNQLSLVSLLVNVLIIPFIPFAMFFGFLAGILGSIWIPLGKAVGWVAWAIGNYQLNVIQYFAKIPFSSISVSLDIFSTILAYAVIFAVLWKLNKNSARPAGK